MSRHRGSGDGEESIYNLIKQATTTQSKAEIYRSKYPYDTPPTGSTFGASSTSTVLTTNLSGDYVRSPSSHPHRKSGAAYGSKDPHTADPSNWQKKHTTRELPQAVRFQYSQRVKPPLSTHHADDSPVTAARTAHLGTSKNFISENALAVIMADARRPVGGDVQYLKKKDYGRVPAYLGQVKQEIEAEKQYIQQVLASQREAQNANEPRLQLLPEPQRVELVTQLKQKWENINKQYQTITHMITLDTMGKVRRKEQYETELTQLEKSIDKLSKPFVYVQG